MRSARLAILAVALAPALGAAPVAITARSIPAGATVTVRGKIVGRTPCDMTLDDGEEATVELSAPGYDTAKVPVVVPIGQGQFRVPFVRVPAVKFCVTLRQTPPEVAQVAALKAQVAALSAAHKAMEDKLAASQSAPKVVVVPAARADALAVYAALKAKRAAGEISELEFKIAAAQLMRSLPANG